jgi:hypothetical protein
MKRIEIFILIFCVLFISLHVWGTIYPSQFNWGTQSFAFYSPLLGVGVLTIVLILFQSALRRKSIFQLENRINKLAPIPIWIVFIAAVILLSFLSLQYPSEGLMWGDSKIILLTTPKIPSGTEVSANFRNQPLVLITLRTVQELMQKYGSGDLRQVYRLVDLSAGAIFLGFVFLFISQSKYSRFEKILTGFLLIAGGGTQFFMGYIENYALLYAFTAGYIVTGWLALKKEINIIFPFILFIIMAGLHLGALVFFPTIFIFFISVWRENKLKSVLFGILTVIITSTIFWFSNYSVLQFIRRIEAAFLYDFLPIFTQYGGSAYTMFAPLHFIDWINLSFLVAPFSILIIIIVFVFFFKQSKELTRNPENIFLLASTILGLIFSFIMNPALGMFRDWDLMASFFVPMMFLTVLILTDFDFSDRKKLIFLFITIVAVIHTSSYIGINADENRHLNRAEILTNPKFMAPFAQALYYDRLANVFWERKDYERTKKWYEQYMAIDSSNPRIIANLSDVYRRLNDRENLFKMLKRTVKLGNRDPKVISNLAVELFKRNQIYESIAMAETAIALAPNYAVGHANLGLIYGFTDNTDSAISHISKAIKLGMSDPSLFRALGDAYEKKGNANEAINWYSKYLTVMPSDTLIENKILKFSTLRKNRPR